MEHPERIGRYPITGVLGEGAMGVVYRGFDPVIKRPLAIKTIRRHLDDGDDAADSIAARFRNEAQAAGRLRHPGIVAVYEYGEDGARAFITMEFVEGTGLNRLLAQGRRFDAVQIVELMVQLLDALHHAHEQGVWHRDIKPANLILTPQGQLKIADFGIARIESVQLTQVTSTIGTPGYMAPEQYVGDAVDRRVDLFAAGAVLFHLLTGRPAFSGSAESVMYRVMNEPVPAPSDVAAAAALAPFDPVVATAMAKRPEDRYPTALAFLEALRSAHAAAARLDDPETVVRPGGRPLALDAATMPRSAAGPHSGASPVTAPQTLLDAGWDAPTLGALERALAVHVGPLARVLVHRAARATRDPSALCASLADSVPDVPDRAALRMALQASLDAALAGRGPTQPVRTVAAPATSPATAARPVALSDELIADATAALTRIVGPIARVLVKRAAQQASDRAQFAERVAEQVEDAADRERVRVALAQLG